MKLDRERPFSTENIGCPIRFSTSTVSAQEVRVYGRRRRRITYTSQTLFHYIKAPIQAIITSGQAQAPNAGEYPINAVPIPEGYERASRG